MYTVLAYRSGVAGADSQERTRFDLEVMHARERESPLNALFRYWLSRRPATGLPTAADFRPRHELAPEYAGTVSWIETGSEDPFRFVLHDHVVHTHGDLSGRTLMAHPCRMHAEACAIEYFMCKTLAVPMYHEIDHVIGGVHRNYVRLLLPVDTGTGRVGAIYYAFRLIRPIASVASDRPVTLAI